MKPTVVFILAHNYSGSTWLSLLLGSHSQAFYCGELNKFYSRSDPMGCALCEELNQPCPYFADVLEHHPKDIHHLLFQRTGKLVLVDNSKRIKWAKKFVNDARFQIKYIHLIKDPRAIYYSYQVRNRPPDIEKWARRNLEIHQFTQQTNHPTLIVPYNEIAAHLDSSLQRICNWIGLDFEAEQKMYWQYEHHGAGKNGATAAFVAGSNGQELDFYQKNFRKNFLDLRWKEKLAPQVLQQITESESVQHVLDLLNLDLDDIGLTPRSSRQLASTPTENL